MNAAIAFFVVVLFIVIAVTIIIAKLVVVGNPNEMVIITGGRGRDGLGYKTLIGGRRVVSPVFNKVTRLSLRNMQVALEVKAQSGGGKMMPVIVTGTRGHERL